MKKTIVILLVLVIGMVGVFANGDDTSQKLTLTTTVEEHSFFRITESSYSENTFYEVLTDPISDVVPSRAVSLENGIAATYLTLGTNQKGEYKVYITALPKLGMADVESKIDYEMSFGNGDTPLSLSTATFQNATEVASIDGTGGASVASLLIEVKLDEVTYRNAQATGEEESYSADVVFDITTT
ncbi:MAG: hypothetical protein WC233_01195 [Sphaerochaeta sp.]